MANWVSHLSTVMYGLVTSILVEATVADPGGGG